MGKGGFPGGFGGGGANMGQLMKQAQKMQKDMEKAHEELSNETIEASSGGGAVKVTFNGSKQLQSISINPEVVDPEDVEMLQDLIFAAVNEGLQKVDELSSQKMGPYAGALKGMF